MVCALHLKPLNSIHDLLTATEKLHVRLLFYHFIHHVQVFLLTTVRLMKLF